MEELFGIITSEHCCLRSRPGTEDGCNESGIEDEIFSGWALRLYPETENAGWTKIETHYGYSGYIFKDEFCLIRREELERRQNKELFFRIEVKEADLLVQPKVQALPLEVLPKNSLVELLERDAVDGWSRIRTASGCEGYLHTRYLVGRRDDDEYLLQTGKENPDLPCGGYFLDRMKKMPAVEKELRECVVCSAKKYLGIQYRWGGKSAQGLDCSGLVFMSYLENGILIYRDAKIVSGYPVHEISKEQLKKGDLIFFPGHVAMYLGDGKYIHSTAYAKTPCVTINSLCPEDSDYREDLARKITACGSIFDNGECEGENGAAEYCRSVLRERLSALPGKISMVYRELEENGETFVLNGGISQRAASVIKLFLMAAVFQKCRDGSLSMETKIKVSSRDCVPSCGVLTYLQGERMVSVRDLVELMIIVSDNTAANLLFDLTGEAYLSDFIQNRLGMRQTFFRRKMFDDVRAAEGLENDTTINDVAELLEGIYRGKVVSAEASAEMYRILTHQRLNGKIPFYLHTLQNSPVIAHKTGEDTGITHDVAVIEGKHPFLLCFMGCGTMVPELETVMADAAKEIYQRRQMKNK